MHNFQMFSMKKVLKGYFHAKFLPFHFTCVLELTFYFSFLMFCLMCLLPCLILIIASSTFFLYIYDFISCALFPLIFIFHAMFLQFLFHTFLCPYHTPSLPPTLKIIHLYAMYHVSISINLIYTLQHFN